MSNDRDPLEQELAGLTPRQPSPELRQRVDAEFEHNRRAVWAAALVAGVVTGALMLLIWFQSGPAVTTTSSRLPAPAPPPVTVPDESLPTMQAYRRALSQSPDEFEALLDRYAAAGTETTTVHPLDRTESVSFGER